MRVVVLSDLHGNLIKVKEPFDLMIICGDVCPVTDHRNQFQREWINNEFSEWIKELPYIDDESKVVMIPGNHDFVFESISKKRLNEFLSKTDGRLVYLDNEEYWFKGLHIFGCPYCKPLPGWAFCRDNLDKYYSYIPDNLDILITHDAADFDKLGTTTEGYNEGRNFGNKKLKEYILKTKPKYYFCGHIHTGTHGLHEYDGIKVANTSILNEDYQVTYEPLLIVM